MEILYFFARFYWLQLVGFCLVLFGMWLVVGSALHGDVHLWGTLFCSAGLLSAVFSLDPTERPIVLPWRPWVFRVDWAGVCAVTVAATVPIVLAVLRYGWTPQLFLTAFIAGAILLVLLARGIWELKARPKDAVRKPMNWPRKGE